MPVGGGAGRKGKRRRRRRRKRRRRRRRRRGCYFSWPFPFLLFSIPPTSFVDDFKKCYFALRIN